MLAGLVLWIPVLGRIPGILRLKPVVRFGYLVAQAVVPAFLSFIYIFSSHPLYPEFARSHAAIGLRPLNDQQIAGFVSKLTMLFVLLIVGAVVLARAPRSEEEFGRRRPAGVGRRRAAVRAGRPPSCRPGRAVRPTDRPTESDRRRRSRPGAPAGTARITICADHPTASEPPDDEIADPPDRASRRRSSVRSMGR